jgi:hypothetical protein
MKMMKMVFSPKVPHGRSLIESLGKKGGFIIFVIKGGRQHD